MAQEQVKNSATGILATALTITGLSCTLSTGQGALFPAANFLVTIDGEILLIVSRSSDTLTIAARGFDGTIQEAHNTGTTVQHTVTAYTFNRLWQNSRDSYHPDVPPRQAILGTTGVPSGAPSIYDNEFESVGSWTLSPTPGSKGLFTAGTSLRSHLIFQSPGDGVAYAAYVPFTPGGAFTATMKISDAINFSVIGITKTTRFYFVVSDQANMASNPSTGNQWNIRIVSNAHQGSNGITERFVQATQFTNGAFALVSALYQLGTTVPVYLRLASDGTTWSAWYGDGWTYNLLYSATTPTFTPKSLGMQWLGDSVSSSPSITAIDFVRVTLGQVLPPYGM